MAGIYGQNDTVNLPKGASVGPAGANPPPPAAPASPWTVQQRNRMGWDNPSNSGYSAQPATAPAPEGTLPFYGGKPQNMPGTAQMPSAGSFSGGQGAAPMQGVQGQGLPPGNRAFYGGANGSPNAPQYPGQPLR